eukprot:12884457-Prorocentrum_lima.AAC.1
MRNLHKRFSLKHLLRRGQEVGVPPGLLRLELGFYACQIFVTLDGLAVSAGFAAIGLLAGR